MPDHPFNGFVKCTYTDENDTDQHYFHKCGSPGAWFVVERRLLRWHLNGHIDFATDAPDDQRKYYSQVSFTPGEDNGETSITTDESTPSGQTCHSTTVRRYTETLTEGSFEIPPLAVNFPGSWIGTGPELESESVTERTVYQNPDMSPPAWPACPSIGVTTTSDTSGPSTLIEPEDFPLRPGDPPSIFDEAIADSPTRMTLKRTYTAPEGNISGPDDKTNTLNVLLSGEQTGYPDTGSEHIDPDSLDWTRDDDNLSIAPPDPTGRDPSLMEVRYGIICQNLTPGVEYTIGIIRTVETDPEWTHTLLTAHITGTVAEYDTLDCTLSDTSDPSTVESISKELYPIDATSTTLKLLYIRPTNYPRKL